VQAKSNFQNSKVSLSVVNTDIEKILDEIENKTGYKFLYREKDLDHSKTITINLKEKEIRTVLDELFTESPINYEFLNDQIILKKGSLLSESSNSKSAVQRQISGVVVDEFGSALAGVNIVVKGTGKGTTTDFDGKYAISASTGDVLSFSYLGFKSIEVEVGESSSINVTLEESTSALDEIVVTAQGIKREKKALGYAVSSVDAAVIQAKPEADVSRILTGKVSGLEINPGGGFLGSTANIIIRSKTSISGSNQPLFIIDGAPISGGRSFDIDPNNIAKIDVLKGLAASTLYGQDGRNGVIVITTKTGQGGTISDKKFEVTASTTLSFLEVANLPEFQNKYGQGGDNTINTTYFGNWGAAFNNQVVPHHLSIEPYNASFPEYKDATTIYQPYKNNVSDFFDIGRGQTTSVIVNKNFDQTSGVSFSLGQTDQKGYIPENALNRLNLNFGGRVELSNNLKINTSVGYTKTETSRPTRGFFNYLTWLPRNLDIHNLPFEDPNDHSSVYYRIGVVNPRWQQKYTGYTSNTDRLFLKSQLDYKLGDNLNVSYLYSLDNYNELNKNWYNGRNGIYPLGFLETYSNNFRTINNRVNFSANDLKLNDKIRFNMVLGAESKNQSYLQNGMLSQDEVVFDFHNHKNYKEHTPFDYRSEVNIVGVYSELRFDYDNYLYLTMAGRNDWGSTVEKANRTLFYPSVSLSWIPTSMFQGLQDSSVDYLKFRIGFGSSANYPTAYQTLPTLNSNPNEWINPYTNSTVITNAVSSFLPNPNIRPELLKETEFGIETRLFKNLIDFEGSVYRRTATDQILFSSLATSTGYSSTVINAGRVDTDGIELGLKLNLFQNSGDGFNWSMNNQFTTYNSEVIELPVDRVDISSGVNYAIEGQPYGVFWGSFYARDDQGNLLINPETGKVIYSSDLGLENKVLGDPNEDWRLTNINYFSYKNLSLSIQWDYIHGGDIWSQTASNLLRRGVTRDTEDREGTYIIPGIFADPNTGDPILDANGDKIANNIQLAANDLYFINLMDVDEGIIYDASVVRLRDISLSYNLPSKVLDKTPFGSATFTFSGNNLWYFAPNLPKYMNLDPEVLGAAANGPSNGKGLDFKNDPSYKQYSVGLKLTF
jgi:TonB-linked SusC/RagA family outer membrane protein